MQKRPKDMTDAERQAIPVKSQLENEPGQPLRLSPFGLNGDDLIGYWQDETEKWWREPYV